MKQRDDVTAVALLVELFEWDHSLEAEWSAYRILCHARGEECPNFDDYKARGGPH